ncbi:MAG: threonylcarbamoyl-AMP synthase [Balneola sp.]|nr:MAG: threonylcarbamoyl-AMP synthase [Balneola sp.]
MADISKYITLIKSGHPVAFPTETVYGLGADAWNPSAIARVFEIKGRPSDNPLIVHVSSVEQANDFVEEITETAKVLMDSFWPGPLSLVLKKKTKVLDAITAGLGTVAIRMPDHPMALELIAQTGPLVAPSANTSGKPSPTKAEHVRQDFGKGFPVIDGEATKIGLESTVIDLTGERPAILRPGSISRKQIEEALGMDVEESFFHHMERPKSPGQKYSHYKPKAEVRWLTEEDDLSDPSTLFLLQEGELKADNLIYYRGNLEQMARELYDRFRQADLEGFRKVVIESIEDSDNSVSSALKNRLDRAIQK